MDQLVDEVRCEENIMATSEARGHIIDLKNQIEDLTICLGEMQEEVNRASEQASTTESRRDEALAQLSSLEESCHERDEV